MNYAGACVPNSPPPPKKNGELDKSLAGHSRISNSMFQYGRIRHGVIMILIFFCYYERFAEHYWLIVLIVIKYLVTW